MPEMTAMPILPVAVAPANPVQTSGNRAAPTENINVPASAQGMENNAANSGTSAVQSDAPDSFAQVLQKQMDMAPAQAQLAATLIVEPAQIFAPSEVPIQDVPPLPLTDATLPLDALNQAVISTQGGDVSVQALPAAVPVQDEDANPSATSIADTVAITLPGLPTKHEIVAKGSDRLAKPDDETQTAGDDALAGQSPYLPGLLVQPAVKLDPASSAEATRDKPAAAFDTAGQFASALQTQKQSPLADNPQLTKLAEASQSAAGKTAEFAATLNTLNDMGQPHPKNEALSSDSDFQNLLAAAQAFSQGRTTAAHAPSASQVSSRLPVDTPVGSHGWDGEVGNKLIWMIGRQEQRAELVLNPPQLGRVEVSLSMNASQTNAVFVSANPAVRDALEAAMPRLREILADAGINLGQAQVGADTGSNGAANQSTNQRENWDNSGRAMNRLDSANTLESLRPLASPQWLKQSNGLVDVFA
ncbi:MAG: flagellar hook-length control protein FliK [Betaproteobacteria bacterium]|nr:flagellar hook-length control protein FliK [Betaproteobacteria bacterium]